MDENKTGVWIRSEGRRKKRIDNNDEIYLNIGDYVQVFSDVNNVLFKVESNEYDKDRSSSFYKLLPVCSIFGEDDKAISPTAGKFHRLVYMRINSSNKIFFDADLSRYINCIDRTSDTLQVVVIRGEKNEDFEIKTCTIPADKIKTDTLNISPSEPILSVSQSNHLEPITATSEAEKNWNQEYYGTFGAKRRSRLQMPTLDDVSDDMNEIRKALKYQRETIEEIMDKLTETKKEKEMYTKKLKEMIKKPIYVDKEITVKEPMLDNNGKQIEKDGKPIFKTKHYHGMVKILWNCGAETVAYVEGNDVYNRENGFKTCVLKYLFGNAGAHDAVDFWTNKYVKYPSSCIEVTENLCKLEEILENDKQREEERKGLPYAKFLRRHKSDGLPVKITASNGMKYCYNSDDSKLVVEFKKLVKKYFPELKGKEIYINDNKNDEIFVAIK